MLTKTKKIITYGPSIKKFLNISYNNMQINNDVINAYKKLINTGVDCIRFNLSHDNVDNYYEIVQLFNQLNKYLDYKISLLFDTKGPEIRVDNIQSQNINDNKISLNQKVIIKCCQKDFVGNKYAFSVSNITNDYYLINDLELNDLIYIDDGHLILKVINLDKIKNEIITNCEVLSYTIQSNKRVNLVNKKYQLPFLSKYDQYCIKKCVEWKIDFLALSFVSNLDHIVQVKNIISKIDSNSNLKIISKIENYESINNLKEIILHSDGIMCARGDLSLHLGYEKIPYYEDLIASECSKYKKICILATQVLGSLEHNLLPTRAEVYDCYNGVKLGYDAIMLSNETAIGLNPINAIFVMNKIILEAEKIYFKKLKHLNKNYNNIIYLNNIKKIIKKQNKNKIMIYSHNDNNWLTLLKNVYIKN